ncbi:MAG: hypothetical protein HYY45_20240 [Deltaproteobacteria bacterium]|nr:hypothetical protein [Deltaproteobacteria bacterium]
MTEDEDKDAIKVEILAVLKKHPEGMKLRDLGNFLGVNWRSLVGLVGSLLRQGKIEKLNGVYFLVRRKSRKRKT